LVGLRVAHWFLEVWEDWVGLALFGLASIGHFFRLVSLAGVQAVLRGARLGLELLWDLMPLASFNWVSLALFRLVLFGFHLRFLLLAGVETGVDPGFLWLECLPMTMARFPWVSLVFRFSLRVVFVLLRLCFFGSLPPFSIFLVSDLGY
jgi:hypothetical protein